MNAIENTPTAPAVALDVNEVLNALEIWINRRPGLDFRDYGQMAPYRAELRSIAKDKRRALAALAQVRRSTNHDAALLADSFRAFSGRLEWIPASTPACNGEPQRAHLEYTTGQYWPTEYRKAAAAVLETYDAAMSRLTVALTPLAVSRDTGASKPRKWRCG